MDGFFILSRLIWAYLLIPLLPPCHLDGVTKLSILYLLNGTHNLFLETYTIAMRNKYIFTLQERSHTYRFRGQHVKRKGKLN